MCVLNHNLHMIQGYTLRCLLERCNLNGYQEMMISMKFKAGLGTPKTDGYPVKKPHVLPNIN